MKNLSKALYPHPVPPPPSDFSRAADAAGPGQDAEGEGAPDEPVVRGVRVPEDDVGRVFRALFDRAMSEVDEGHVPVAYAARRLALNPSGAMVADAMAERLDKLDRLGGLIRQGYEIGPDGYDPARIGTSVAIESYRGFADREGRNYRRTIMQMQIRRDTDGSVVAMPTDDDEPSCWGMDALAALLAGEGVAER